MALSTFSAGAHVVVLTLGRKRGTITAVGRDGRYQVRVERLTMWCRREHLVESTDAQGRRQQPSSQLLAITAPPPALARTTTPRVDLHGRTVEEAMPLVLAALDAALRDGADRMEIVHGKGTGRIKHAVHAHLSTISAVRAFDLDPHNPGVTWVSF